MYHPYYPWGAYDALFWGFSWTMILFIGGANGVQLKLKMTKSCSWVDRFVLNLDLRIRFRLVVDWSKSLYHNCNGEFLLTLHNTSTKWFLNVRIDRSNALRWCMFDGTNWNTIFLTWRLWMRMLEDLLSSFWKRGLKLWFLGCCIMFHMHLRLIVFWRFAIDFIRMTLLS